MNWRLANLYTLKVVLKDVPCLFLDLNLDINNISKWEHVTAQLTPELEKKGDTHDQ